MLVYEADLPALPDPLGDIVNRHLTVSADGTVILDTDIDMTVTKTPEFGVADGANVTLSLTHIDDAGNPSPPSEQSFTAHDTIAPSAPGAFGEVRLLRDDP